MEQKEKLPMIKFEGVRKIYGDDPQALDNINLEIQPGEFVSIVGHSGAGKSTLLKLIYAEEMPTEGIVYFNGKPLDSINRRKISGHRRQIGNVFQDFKLLPKKNLFENVAYALEVAGVSNDEIRENVPQILDIVGLKDKIGLYPHQVSGGEQQKVAMARALIHRPVLIVADEPTGNLDPVSSLEIVDLLLKINEMGTTVLLASHDRDIVNRACRRVIKMERGRIVSDDLYCEYKM